MDDSKKEDLPSLEKLEQEIKAAKTAYSHSHPVQTDEKGGAASQAFKVGIDLVAGVLVGTGVGYLLDKWLNTTPIFFLICFFLGAIAGGLNVYKMTKSDEGDGHTK